MKVILQSMLYLALLVITSQVYAECPSTLNADQMILCIRAENSGYIYTPPTKTNDMSAGSSSSEVANYSDGANKVANAPPGYLNGNE
ncbi:MAG: hypothetical protein HY080_17110 [Gammaproteobacteria bacterium]|nr:hypothetical protein [Gammaproteobacteria bacterium]